MNFSTNQWSVEVEHGRAQHLGHGAHPLEQRRQLVPRVAEGGAHGGRTTLEVPLDQAEVHVDDGEDLPESVVELA